MAPRQSGLTFTPVRPSVRCTIPRTVAAGRTATLRVCIAGATRAQLAQRCGLRRHAPAVDRWPDRHGRHSYGGAVISNAATGNDEVQALVYINGWVPDEGESLIQLAQLNE